MIGKILTLGAVSKVLVSHKSTVCAPADKKLPDLEPGSTSARGRFQLRCAPVGQKLSRLRAGEEIDLRARKGVPSREEGPSCVCPSWRFSVFVSSRLDSTRLVSPRHVQHSLLSCLVQLLLAKTLEFPRDPRDDGLGP